jgi:hypothetical protein
MDSQEQMANLNAMLNRVLSQSPEFSRFFTRQANYTYYEDRATKDRYFWTAQKINHKGHPRYVAGIYRFLKSKKVLKLVKKVGFAKKKRAIAWALEHHRRATEIKEPVQAEPALEENNVSA